MVRRIAAGAGSLAAYLRSALADATLSSRPQVRELFPMAPPYPWCHGAPPELPAARGRWRLNRAIKIYVNLVVISLSHLACRGSRRCPLWARSGASLSEQQYAVVVHLEEMCSSYLDPAAPQSDRAFRSQALLERSFALGQAPLDSSCPPPSSSFAGEVAASRTTYAKADANFDCTPFLNVFTAACFLEPRLLLPRDADLPKISSGAQRGSSDSILGFLRQWDARGRLHLEPPHSTSRFQQGTLFAVPKSADEDRVVFNPASRGIRWRRI